MEEKYKAIYSQLKQEAKNTLEGCSTDKFIEEFKSIVKARIQEIHAKLDVKKNEIIKLALEAYEKDSTKLVEEAKVEVPVKTEDKIEEKPSEDQKTEKEDVATQKKDEPEKKELVPAEIKNEEQVIKSDEFKSKIKGLIGTLKEVLTKTETLEETITVFKEKKLNELLEIKDNDFLFKIERRLKFKLLGKVFWDLGWSPNQNKPVNSDISKDDDKQLLVHSNSCYNYFITDKSIKDEVVLVTFETNIIKTDNYFYFGVVNSNVSYNNNCLCTTIGNAVYIRSNGILVENSTTKTYNSLRFDTGTNNTIEVKVDGKEKKVYFRVNEKEEEGPFSISGDTLTITSGSCNTANGYIKLVSSLIIG